MSKLLKSLVVVALLVGILASCHGQLKETYVVTSIRNAANGTVVSAGGKYCFDSPNVIGAFGNVALIREGHAIDFFIGDNIEAKLKNVEGKKYALYVRKYFSPYVHFIIDFMTAGTDTIQVGEVAAKLPALRPMRDFTPPDDYIKIAYDKLTASRLTLKEIQEKKFQVAGAKVGFMQTTDESGASVGKFTINLKNVKFFVNETNDGVLAILKAMQNEDSNFDGGLQYGTIPASRSEREKLGIGGDVKIGYFMYGGNVVVLAM
jgi:hypothetical protein